VKSQGQTLALLDLLPASACAVGTHSLESWVGGNSDISRGLAAHQLLSSIV